MLTAGYWVEHKGQMDALAEAPTRERLLHFLYEAAELEHNLMCTYLYAAFSLRSGASANKPFCDNSHVRIGFKS